ncbi:MAG: DUF58 domain-containing protein [Steroidobacteraceae bacterium]|jgi:uncharacterized protein (DUF58 family)|nr:DUF58 domain-containing protein [Steroidobacteraceae bacterium]
MARFAGLRQATHRWIRRRQGPDAGPVTLHGGRIYILPTRLGLAFGVMLFGMFLGSLNYANNLGLGLTFLLASLGLVAMHACHRNLAGVTLRGAGTEPPFAGQEARFLVSLDNPSVQPRLDLEATAAGRRSRPVSVDAEADAGLTLCVPTRRRGRVRLVRYELETRYPFSLFRAWAVLHPEADCLVYPAPAAAAPPPPPSDAGSADGEAGAGEEDFAGLKDYHPGDPPRRIAWKAHARGGELLVKQFAGTVTPAPVFDLANAPGADLEARLSVMARWIVDAHAAGEAFGLRLPGIVIPPEPGERQRRRCLEALAEFQAPERDDA